MAFAPLRERLASAFAACFAWVKRHRWATAGICAALFLAAEYASLPPYAEIASLRTANPRVTALMEQRIGEAGERGKRFAIRQQWVRLGKISGELQHAVIVAEDGAFYEHGGVDWFEVKESIKKDIQKRRFARGASTITQQLAKNLFLSTSKDPVRKLKELLLSSLMEGELTKNRIFEVYLNVIEWGDGVFGAEAAAMKYFGKHAGDLSREEAARMAAVIPSPLRHAPNSDSPYVLRRTRMILARMEARGW